MLTEAQNDNAAIAELLGSGVRAIVHKNGADGAAYHDPNGSIMIGAFDVEEIDPTGAGDCFGGTFTTFWLRGMPAQEALRKAAAAGALAIMRKGPMEGASTAVEIDAFLQKFVVRGAAL